MRLPLKQLWFFWTIYSYDFEGKEKQLTAFIPHITVVLPTFTMAEPSAVLTHPEGKQEMWRLFQNHSWQANLNRNSRKLWIYINHKNKHTKQLNSFPLADAFWPFCSRQFLKYCGKWKNWSSWANFCICHNVFNCVQIYLVSFLNFYIVLPKCFQSCK